MKTSMRTKITLMVVSFAALIVFASWIICNYVFESIFINNLKYNLVETYNACNYSFSEYLGKTKKDGEFILNIKNSSGAFILIMGDDGKFYSTINDHSEMLKSMKRILDSLEDETDTVLYGYDKQYTITRNHDNAINADYYDLIGSLDNGYKVFIRCSVSQLEYTMNVISKVFVYIAIGVILFGSIFILALSNIFVTPIKAMCYAAKKFTKLEFDTKVLVCTKDEIGELGKCMNDMSMQLENTISELKKANIELKKDIKNKNEIDEMRKEFLSHVSHELKTPIALIQGYAEGLRDNVIDDQESMNFYTEVIVDESRKMNDLVKKLLTLNEIEFGNEKVRIEQFELTNFIKAIIDAKSILLQDGNNRIIFEEQDDVYVWADEYMIEEVFTNYLTNAIHYVREDGIIKVYYEKKENDIRVCVFNEGNHISDEDIDKLFIKFYKVDKARTREYGGNGIGLSIVAATMEAHGKAYGVENVEGGVVFYFDLDVNKS
ncbi:MAG: histidine kinase dimerization/phospho-acceptor domain-containing protein [Lachnospiraceae bacterium]|nr:histidine kinase dimerization/phospho-acceptor domain-containing protein [Lachnospiraceae bacterium]